MNPGSTCFRLAFSMTGLDTGVWLHILCNVILPPFFLLLHVAVFKFENRTFQLETRLFPLDTLSGFITL